MLRDCPDQLLLLRLGLRPGVGELCAHRNAPWCRVSTGERRVGSGHRITRYVAVSEPCMRCFPFRMECITVSPVIGLEAEHIAHLIVKDDPTITAVVLSARPKAGHVNGDHTCLSRDGVHPELAAELTHPRWSQSFQAAAAAAAGRGESPRIMEDLPPAFDWGEDRPFLADSACLSPVESR